MDIAGTSFAELDTASAVHLVNVVEEGSEYYVTINYLQPNHSSYSVTLPLDSLLSESPSCAPSTFAANDAPMSTSELSEMSLSLQASATSTCQDSPIVSVVGVSGSDATAQISTASPVLVGSKRQAKKRAHKKTPKLGVTTRTRARM